jgi:hypothetical protein
VQNTHLDPGWSGWLTLEISNNSLDEIVINAGEPIAQLVFELLDVPTEQPYAGKYQHQKRGPQSALDETPPAVAGQRELNERFEHIERAYHAALDGRYPETVSVLDLQPAILAAATPASKRLPRCSAGGRARLSAERTSCCANSGSASDDRRARRHHHRARWQSRSSSMSR